MSCIELRGLEVSSKNNINITNNINIFVLQQWSVNWSISIINHMLTIIWLAMSSSLLLWRHRCKLHTCRLTLTLTYVAMCSCCNNRLYLAWQSNSVIWSMEVCFIATTINTMLAWIQHRIRAAYNKQRVYTHTHTSQSRLFSVFITQWRELLYAGRGNGMCNLSVRRHATQLIQCRMSDWVRLAWIIKFIKYMFSHCLYILTMVRLIEVY